MKNKLLSCDGGEIFSGATTILFGSMGSIAETLELQLKAFNKAFRGGLEWEWTTSQYKPMLVQAGGRKRINEFSKATNSSLSQGDIEKIHTMKGEFFIDFLESSEVRPRNGVKELMEQCVSQRIKLGWVTTTSEQNISALKAALKGQIDFDSFEVIMSIEQCSEPKPSPIVYEKALEFLTVGTETVVTVEDSTSGVSSSKQAGIFTITFPGDYLKNMTSLADICLEI